MQPLKPYLSGREKPPHNRLTDANPIEDISEPGSPAHAERVAIQRQLADRPGDKPTRP